MRGLSLVAKSGGHSSSRCAGLSLSRPLLLQSTGSRRSGSVVVAHRPSCSAACGIFPDQGSNPCPLHWHSTTAPPGKPNQLILNSSLILGSSEVFLKQTFVRALPRPVDPDSLWLSPGHPVAFKNLLGWFLCAGKAKNHPSE